MSATAVGALRFARYALAPNALGYCGPGDPAELAGAAGAKDVRAVGLLAPEFAAAYPYLRLIAASAGIDDPLDERVVDGYWLGGPLAHRVAPRVLAAHLDDRYGALLGRLRPALGAAALAGGICSHSLHVLAATPFGALVRDDARRAALGVCDACRIRPARVTACAGSRATVVVRPLVVVAGRLLLGPPQQEAVTLSSATRDVAVGDVVALHWGVACEVLDRNRARRLVTSTAQNLSALENAGPPPLLAAAETNGG